jgi:pimeloyl-ACP methyl ester carboxylesterase
LSICTTNQRRRYKKGRVSNLETAFDGQGVDTVAEHRVIRPGDVEIAYWIHGEGTPLVMITGLATPAAAWGPMPGMLAGAGYKVIVIDNRDCGKSSSCEGLDYTISDMADDIAAVMDDAGVAAAYVLSISMGGMIAQEFVLNHPSRVTKLMLMATTPGSPNGIPPTGEFLSRMFAPATNGDASELMTRTLTMITAPGFAAENPERVQTLAEVRVELGSNPDQFARQWQAILGYGTWDRLPEIDVPTIIIHGDADVFVPYPNGKLLAGRIKGAEFVSLPGIGHLIPLEAPAETFGLIARFFPVKQEGGSGGVAAPRAEQPHSLEAAIPPRSGAAA